MNQEQTQLYLKNVYCDKCGKETVVETIENPTIEQPSRQSMADYQGRNGIVTLVYRPIRYKLQCKSCGNARTFSK